MNTYRTSIVSGVVLRAAPPFFIALLATLFTSLFLSDSSPVGQATVSAVPLAVITLYMLIRHRSLCDGNFTFFVFFALHYSVMVPIYTSAGVWASFWQREIAHDWSLTTTCNWISLLGLSGYCLGIFAAEAAATRAGNLAAIPLFHYPVFEKQKGIKKVTTVYLLIGIAAWAAIVVQNPDIVSLLLGRPLNRMTFPEYGGAYLFMVLFAVGHAYLLFTYLIRKSRYFLMLSVLALLPTLYLLLVKGARHEFVIIPFAAYILHRRERPFITRASLIKIFSRATLSIGALAVATAFLVFYTRYRSGLEVYSFEEIPYFLHSLADGAGYMIVVKTVPATFDYWYGMTYLYPILNHIPSAIFPDKYQYMYGVNRFTEQFYGYDATLDTSTVSHTYSLLGEVYFNFGSYGVPFLLFILGYFTTKFYRAYLSHTSSFLLRYCYSLYVPIFILYTVKAGIVSGLLYYFQNVLLIFAIPLILLSRKRLPRAYQLTATSAGALYSSNSEDAYGRSKQYTTSNPSA